MNWFKKKPKVEGAPKKLDFDNYKMRLSIRAICMFERLSGKSFYNFDEEDLYTLVYAIFVTSNDILIKESTFMRLLEDERVAKWVGDKMNVILDYIQQFNVQEEGENGANSQEELKDITISSVANTLIVHYGVDAHYVMDEMQLWEIGPAFEVVDSMVKERYEENRLWTYLGILPHIDGKKLNKPEKLLPFPWEAEKRKQKQEELLKQNEYAVKNLIGKKLDFIK